MMRLHTTKLTRAAICPSSKRDILRSSGNGNLDAIFASKRAAAVGLRYAANFQRFVHIGRGRIFARATTVRRARSAASDPAVAARGAADGAAAGSDDLWCANGAVEGRVVVVDDDEFEDERLRSDIDRHASMAPHPLSVRSVLSVPGRWEAAKFLFAEFPVRVAERIRMIESIPGWRDVPELAEVRRRHAKAFREVRRSRLAKAELPAFTSVVSEIVSDDADTVSMMAGAMSRLCRDEEGEPIVDSSFVDEFLNDFLLNRLGCSVLTKQYLALCGPEEGGEWGGRTGIIDPACNAAEVCREAGRAVQRVCRAENEGLCPRVAVEAYSAIDAGCDDDSCLPTFSYIPAALTYILQELIKNSCHATVGAARGSAAEVSMRPVKVVVSADERHVMICVADRAGGIPFDVTKHVWSYLYSTKGGKEIKRSSSSSSAAATEMGGYGIGLPLSRLYATYLGGSVNLVSLPGYGTNAYVFLPRLSTDQVEVVPDRDYDWHRKDLFGELVL